MQQEITELLNQWGRGDQTALERLMPLIYAELHKLARRHMRGQNPDHTLQTTALINEAWLRMAGDSGKHWNSRTHFYGVAAKAMRHVLVDYARARYAAKRGAGVQLVPLEEDIGVSGERLTGLIALDEALTRLGELHSRQSRIVELRFFGGFSVEDTADVLQVSAETVMLDWRAAKAWLHKELSRNDT
jgi:RNA polymerase sigma factor (TIGR02999 family)